MFLQVRQPVGPVGPRGGEVSAEGPQMPIPQSGERFLRENADPEQVVAPLDKEHGGARVARARVCASFQEAVSCEGESSVEGAEQGWVWICGFSPPEMIFCFAGSYSVGSTLSSESRRELKSEEAS